MTMKLRNLAPGLCLLAVLVALSAGPVAAEIELAADVDEEIASTDATEVPAETEPPADTEPTTDTSAPDDGTDTTEVPDDDAADEDSGNSGRNLVIIVVATLLIVGVAYLAFRPRGSSQDRRAGSARGGANPAAAPSINLDDRVLGDVSWLNDQLSLNLLSAPAEQAAQRWRTERPRIEALARDCQRLEESTGDPIWGALAGEVAALAQTLDTATSARVGADVDPSVTRQSIELVNRHRSQLAGLATQVRHR